MGNVTSIGYSGSDMNEMIHQSTKLLVSYISHQDAKTEVLKIIITEMDKFGKNILLRHGNIIKDYKQGADMLRGKNTDQLSVTSSDPVVTRKIQIKLNNLMCRCKPADVPEPLLADVIEDATKYLAVHLLQPQIIQVCKCMKNVFVQCELWCDEILRRVTRPCCTCSRYVTAQTEADHVPTQGLRISPNCSRAFAPGVDITFKKCSSMKLNSSRSEIPETGPTEKKALDHHDKPTSSQVMYSTTYNQNPITMWMTQQTPSNSKLFETPHSKTDNVHHKRGSRSSLPDVKPVLQSPVTMHVEQHTAYKADFNSPSNTETGGTNSPVVSDSRSRSRRSSPSGYTARTPIISTDQMLDWHSMLVSLMWNLQAWRDWIQENIDKALAYEHECEITPALAQERWATLQRSVATEALQWRQYNNFSRQLIMGLASRYKNKRIVSPTRATVKTNEYLKHQEEMLEIINIFNKWTHWLILVIKETDAIRPTPGSKIPLYEL